MGFKKILIGFLGILTIIGGFYFLGPIRRASSATDNVALRIRTEVTTDNGETWQNTTGTDYSGGQTVNLCEGENFEIRTRIWNSGTKTAYHVTGLSSATNSGDNPNPTSASVTVNTNDEDGDGTAFDRVAFTNNGSIYVASVAPNGSYDNGYQGSIVTIQPPNECPSSGTEVYLTTNIQDYSPTSGGNWQGPQDILKINSAGATGIGNYSTVRIVPCGCGGQSSGQAQTSLVDSSDVTSLPQTGADLE